ncbi:hypothetical protein R69927_07804 [Paraburkholderia domus]|nr:hypothetical protein R69927_07804 [Paraburkholderia domus]
MQDSRVNVPGSCKSHNTISASNLRRTRLSELFRVDSLTAASTLSAFVCSDNVNVIVWTSLQEKFRHEALAASLLAMYGTWQCEGEGRHLVAQRLVDLSPARWAYGCQSQLLLNTRGHATTRIRRCHRGSGHRAYDSNSGPANCTVTTSYANRRWIRVASGTSQNRRVPLRCTSST